jgi:tRNA(fMet)-specific endonuclease VapC
LTLLDANVVIHFLKGNPAIVQRMRKPYREELAIPTIVIYELEYGTLRAKLPAKRRRELSEGLEFIRHVPFDSEAAMAAAAIRVALEKIGALIGPLDLLIAGTAVSRGATLVTNNTAEFSRVPGLRVVDWLASLS